MSFLCLTAVYNHRQEWLESLIQAFYDQDYEGPATLVVVDDRSSPLPDRDLLSVKGRSVFFEPIGTRAPSLMAKYAHGFLEYTGDAYDYVCVMDDDDGYLPDHLSQHAAVLANHPWSYPKEVFSSWGGRMQIEQSGGRFWASSAYRTDALEEIGGYLNQDTLRADFDTHFLQRLQDRFGGPKQQKYPTYIYNWEATGDNHSSGHIDAGVWKYREIPEARVTGPVKPGYSAVMKSIYEMAYIFRGGMQ
jgi:glycosyltransferase involved in cell wall biosynthesis